MAQVTVGAEPEPIAIDPARTALIVIDMQRDFIEPGGFGETLGNDVSLLRAAIEPCKRLIATARALGMLVIHTREGHRADLSDAPRAKVERGAPSLRIGSPGPMGRILIRGEKGHDIIPELYPIEGEPVIDKPGKGSFCATDLELMLRTRSIANLVLTGITTDVCVHTTMREANDRGFECLILEDCTGATDKGNHLAALKMVEMQGGVFGAVASSTAVIEAIA
jgi:nicotinamidase-related amidase